jgi:hypothetical protein
MVWEPLYMSPLRQMGNRYAGAAAAAAVAAAAAAAATAAAAAAATAVHGCAPSPGWVSHWPALTPGLGASVHVATPADGQPLCVVHSS